MILLTQYDIESVLGVRMSSFSDKKQLSFKGVKMSAMKNAFMLATRPDTRAKTVRLALLILRSIPSSILSSIHLTVDEYDNEWNDEKHDFLHLSRAI